MSGIELATAYISLVPSMKGVSRSINQQLGGVNVSAAGKTIGSNLGDSMSSGFSSSGVVQLQNEVSKASSALVAAQTKEKDAIAQVDIAQKKLNETRKKYAADSSQVASAELKLTQAKRSAASASAQVASAEQRASTASKNLATAQSQASSSMKNSASTMSSLSGKSAGLAGAIGGVAATIADSAINAIASLSSEMIAASDSTDKFKQTLNFAGIDSSTIDALTKSTQEYADRTVYDLADIRSVTAQLAANGVSDYAQLAEAAGNLNAVAGGNADTFRSVSMVLSQTAGSGKLMTENWNQLTDAIPGASGKLQEAMRNAGAFEGNFREAMEKGEISADEFFAAVQQLGMTDVAVEAATSTSTIEGALGNLQAAVVGVGASAITALKPMITGAMTALANAIGQIPSLFEGIGSAFSNVFSMLEDNGSIQILSTAFSSLIPVFQSLLNIASSLGQGFMEALNPLSVVSSFVDTFRNVVTAVQPVVATVGQSLISLGATLQSSLQPALSTIGQSFNNLATTMIPLIGQAISAVLPVVGQVISVVMQIVGVVLPIVSQIAATLIPAITSIATMVMSFAANIVSVVMPVVSSILSLIQTAMPYIQTVITNSLNMIFSVWNTVWPAIQSVVSTVLGVVQSVISSVMGVIKGIITAATQVMQGNWSGAWDTIKSLVSSALSGIKSAVSSGISNVVSYFTSLPGKISSALGGLASRLMSIGRDAIQGLANGISNAGGAVLNAITGAVDGAINKAKEMLGIASPSKLFRQFGIYTMQGMAIGISKSTKTVEAAMNSAMSDVYGVAESYAARQATLSLNDDGGTMSRTDAILLELLDRLPNIISDNTPSEFTVGGRGFASAVKRVIPT